MEYNSYSYEIPQTGTDDNNDPIFKHIIPGDIYVQPGHVTIIQDVVFSDLNNRQIDYSNTILIEATPRNTTNTRNLNELPNCDPRRIKE